MRTITYNLLLEKFMTARNVPNNPKHFQVKWNLTGKPDDVQSAQEYLNLNMPRKHAEHAVNKLAKHLNRVEWYKAKDILRSAGFLHPNGEAVFPVDNPGVKHKLKKIEKNESLDPVLLVLYNGKLMIADGTHRVCAAYYENENNRVACILVHEKE